MQAFSDMLKINDNEQIVIDSQSNIVTFPNRVQVVKDKLFFNDKTKSAVYIISQALKMRESQTAKLDYDKATDNYAIYFDGVVCVNKTEQEMTSDIRYALQLVEQNIKSVYFCLIDYDMDGTYFHNATGKMDIEKIIYTYGVRAYRDSIKERVALMKSINAFNEKLSGIKRFTFQFGNAFGGIKKLQISFDDELVIKSNSGEKIAFTSSKEEIIKELGLFCFPAWQDKYNANANPVLENAWTIELVFEREELAFTGLDDYPKTWDFVEFFVKKYACFNEIKD